MALRELIYAINDVNVTPPDEEVWSPIVAGVTLSGLERRSPVWKLEWTKRVGSGPHLDWFQFDGQVLNRLVCRGPGDLDVSRTYTDARCQSVTMRQQRGAGTEITAVFLVNVESS